MNTRTDITPPIPITVEQIQAMHHMCMDEHQEPQVLHGHTADGWLLLGIASEDGGVWLAPDGGWHYGPGEAGYYPWRDEAPQS